MTKSSKELLLDLLVWSEKNTIDLEKWIMTIRLENLAAKRFQQGADSRPATKLGSIEHFSKGIVSTNDTPLTVGQVS